MAKFRLLTPHYFQLELNEPLHLQAGAEVDTATMPPWFKPTLQMQPLDDAATAMLKALADAPKPARRPDPLLKTGQWGVYN
jgi:hypothetical protein